MSILSDQWIIDESLFRLVMPPLLCTTKVTGVIPARHGCCVLYNEMKSKKTKFFKKITGVVK